VIEPLCFGASFDIGAVFERSRRTIMFGKSGRIPVLVLVAVALTAGAARAAGDRGGTTIIIKCVYVNDPGFTTRVAGVEVAGPGRQPAVLGTTCAEAFNALMDAGFKLVHSGKIPGSVDTADYIVWRRCCQG
jgi:hypothetical protein